MAVSGKPAMLCDFGRQFSGWVRDIAAPLTLAYTGAKLTEIETVSAFACRARTDKPELVASEHAKGDAIDVASFVLADKRRIRVKEEGSDLPLARDLRHALRMAACGYFTTVLGPGSNPAHAEHFHSTPAFMARRRTTGFASDAFSFGVIWTDGRSPRSGCADRQQYDHR